MRCQELGALCLDGWSLWLRPATRLALHVPKSEGPTPGLKAGCPSRMVHILLRWMGDQSTLYTFRQGPVWNKCLLLGVAQGWLSAMLLACTPLVKKQLSIWKHAPAPYNVTNARVYFPFIDSYFVPVGQRDTLSAEDVSQDCHHEGDWKTHWAPYSASVQMWSKLQLIKSQLCKSGLEVSFYQGILHLCGQ